MDWAGIATVLGAATVLVTAIATAAVKIINALHENTQTVQANIVDRAEKTAVTVAAAEKTDGTLTRVAAQVADLHDVSVIGAANAPSAAPAPQGGPVAPTG